ncbi:MAG TPA: lipopolysaccharide heptosyltransferase II [Candidatus Omnitrophica bacterium]|nr:MAG: lipopolysaccharide heptosyltransferase II [Omnitrophica WOR_2 bacterium RIFCSPHIGHO2_02_FULL_63_39]HBH96166.1 lipopolysaccharide heptosyltransferase II [Candidatus Omnitrophota bacterium]
MHILQLIPSLDVGGVERGVLDLTKGLLARGHRVTVVSAGGALVEPLTRLGAIHHTLPVHRKSPWSMWRTVPALCRVIEGTGIEVVHARSRVPAWIGYVASRRTRRPFVTTCHGFYAPHPASRVMAWGRIVVVPSHALGRYVIDQFHVPPERLRVIPRGVDLSEFQFAHKPPPADGPWRLGLIGRLSVLKGHEVAIRALHQLSQRRHPVRLCFVGEASAHKPRMRSGLERLAHSLGVADLIDWQGMRRDIPEALRALDAVLVPSVYPESFGRTVIEAQAAGVPVIASRLGALAEIVEDGTTGLLVPPGDAGALAAAIARLIGDEPLRRRLVQAARERVEGRFRLEGMVDGYEAVYRDCVTNPRVVIWKLSAMGDFVLATPSLRAIRRRFPTSHISVVVGQALGALAARCPYVNDVILYDPKRRDWTRRAARRVIRRVRQGAFDLSIDLQNSRLTHLMAWASDIPTRVGYDRRWGRSLSQRVSLPRRAMDPVSHQFELLRSAGIPPDGMALELWPTEQDEQAAHRLMAELRLDSRKPLVGLHPGGSARWRTKRWAPARWAALCDRLADAGAQVVITGSTSEQPLIDAVRQLTASAPALVVGRTSLMELAALIRRCAVFVTHDSAPLHVAVAMGRPTIALFGPTDPARHAPPSPLVHVVSKKVFCSPCYSPRCRTITHACMTRITVDDVFDTVLELLNPKSKIQNPKSPSCASST